MSIVDDLIEGAEDKAGLESAIACAYEFLARAGLETERLRMLTLKPNECLRTDLFAEMATIAKRIGQLAVDNGAVALCSAAASAESAAHRATFHQDRLWNRSRDQIADCVGVMESIIAAARRELGIGST